MQSIQYLSILADDISELEAISERVHKYNDGEQHPHNIVALLAAADVVGFRVCEHGQTIGAFFLTWDEHGESRLHDFFIVPEFQGQGIGRQVWSFITSCYPSLRWSIELHNDANQARYFFEKVCGFRVKAISKNHTLLAWQRKVREHGQPTVTS